MLAIASETGWTQAFIAWELPLGSFHQYLTGVYSKHGIPSFWPGEETCRDRFAEMREKWGFSQDGISDCGSRIADSPEHMSAAERFARLRRDAASPGNMDGR